MKRFLKSLARLGYHQATNLFKFATGQPISVPSLGSMTLDFDDVELAKHWLNHLAYWDRSQEIEEYQKAFAAWNNSEYAFCFMGGRVALSAIIFALELEKGDEVILPGYTCVVVPNAFHYMGIKTIYSDIELETFGLDASNLESKITPKTKAIILHHLYGLVCRDYEKIIEIGHRNNLYIVEDCAHSTGAEYKGKKVGNYGDAAFYSSEQSKVFNTIQGGVATTNNPNIAKRIQEFYQQAGKPDRDWVQKQLYNVILNYYEYKDSRRWLLGDLSNIRWGRNRLVTTSLEEEMGKKPQHYGKVMPAPIAALGLNQLRKIDFYNEQRRKTANQWDKWCQVHGHRRPTIVEHSKPIFLRYPILVEAEKKRDLTWAIKELGVVPGVWFVSNIHPTPQTVTGCPNADTAVNQCINLPCLINS